MKVAAPHGGGITYMREARRSGTLSLEVLATSRLDAAADRQPNHRAASPAKMPPPNGDPRHAINAPKGHSMKNAAPAPMTEDTTIKSMALLGDSILAVGLASSMILPPLCVSNATIGCRH